MSFNYRDVGDVSFTEAWASTPLEKSLDPPFQQLTVYLSSGRRRPSYASPCDAHETPELAGAKHWHVNGPVL